MEQWEQELIWAFENLNKAMRNEQVPKSKNMDIAFDELRMLQLRIAYQTGNYSSWGL